MGVVGRVRGWLHNDAWPFWSDSGVDHAFGGFVERLRFCGGDAEVPYKRVRAQARQVFCFSQAALLGFPGGAAASDHGWAFLQAHGRREDGGWISRMGRAGGMSDATADSYDVAFVLFAHAWRYRLTGDPAVIAGALDTLACLNRDLRHPNGLGWLAAEGDRGPRQQNPHMHLLEAALELVDATGHPAFVDLAIEIVRLFATRMLCRDSHSLCEFYADDWSRMAGEAGRIVEPGHHFEWVWILLKAERLLGIPLRDEATLLYDFAIRHGCDPSSGLVYDQIDPMGAPLSRDSRSWPQTEALKAHLAMMALDGVDRTAAIGNCVDNIFAHYLCGGPAGTWTDHRRHDGAARSVDIPSTTLYHLQLAFSELLRLEPMVSNPHAIRPLTTTPSQRADPVYAGIAVANLRTAA